MVAKLVLAGGILAYLLWQVREQEGFAGLVEQDKDWRSVILGVLCVLVAVTLSFVRWHILVRALGLEFRLLDALRLGAAGFALNFVALGNVGGDLFKAIVIARDQPGRRTAAVATIAVDRGLGIFTFLALASTAILVTNMDAGDSTAVRVLARSTLLTTGIGLGTLALVLFLPGLTGNVVTGLLGRIPLAGPVIVELLKAVGAYRNSKRMLLGAFGVSIVVDAVFILSFYLVARGLPMRVPTLVEHYFIVPLALVAGSIPITPSGLGTMEAAVNALYQVVPSGAQITEGTGTLATLAHRVAMMTVGALGVLFYVSQRGALRQSQQAVEH